MKFRVKPLRKILSFSSVAQEQRKSNLIRATSETSDPPGVIDERIRTLAANCRG